MHRLALQPDEYAKMLLVGIVIFGQFIAVVFAAVIYFHVLAGLNADCKLFFCTIKSGCSVFFPTLQFVWWIFLLRFLFFKAKNNLLDSVACKTDTIDDGTSASFVTFRVQRSLNTLKRVFEMKKCIIRHYGFFVLLHPIGWLTALLHTCCLLFTDVGSVNVAILFVHAIVSLFQLYLPFWFCQITTVSVSFKFHESHVFSSVLRTACVK